MSAIPKPEHDEADGGETIEALDTANLRLAKRFVSMVFADPSIADAIPAEANVIFLPHDDPALAARHRAAGERMRAAGRIVHFFEV